MNKQKNPCPYILSSPEVIRMRGFRQWRLHLEGETQYLWRAVDNEGEILSYNVAKKRDDFAAFRFFKKAPKRHGSLVEIAI